LKEKCNVFILDHHKTAEEELKDIDDKIFDMHHSGAYLSWNYFYDFDNENRSVVSSKVREFILLIEDRDLWTNKYGDKTLYLFNALCEYLNCMKDSNEKIILGLEIGISIIGISIRVSLLHSSKKFFQHPPFNIFQKIKVATSS
jgi:oligoribonuclease NrnB/cAMP/cGMP phosphodiesterase (DHH superfamily)